MPKTKHNKKNMSASKWAKLANKRRFQNRQSFQEYLKQVRLDKWINSHKS